MTTYKPKLGIDGPIYFGSAGSVPTESDSNRLQYINGPTISISYETEELDMVVTGMTKAYINGKLDLTVSFTMLNFQSSGSYPADIAAIIAAMTSGGALGIKICDSAIGDISGDFIVSKMDENRTNGKVSSWSVELKPTFEGTALTISGRSSND